MNNRRLQSSIFFNLYRPAHWQPLVTLNYGPHALFRSTKVNTHSASIANQLTIPYPDSGEASLNIVKNSLREFSQGCCPGDAETQNSAKKRDVVAHFWIWIASPEQVKLLIEGPLLYEMRGAVKENLKTYFYFRKEVDRLYQGIADWLTIDHPAYYPFRLRRRKFTANEPIENVRDSPLEVA